MVANEVVRRRVKWLGVCTSLIPNKTNAKTSDVNITRTKLFVFRAGVSCLTVVPWAWAGWTCTCTYILALAILHLLLSMTIAYAAYELHSLDTLADFFCKMSLQYPQLCPCSLSDNSFTNLTREELLLHWLTAPLCFTDSPTFTTSLLHFTRLSPLDASLQQKNCKCVESWASGGVATSLQLGT